MRCRAGRRQSKHDPAIRSPDPRLLVRLLSTHVQISKRCRKMPEHDCSGRTAEPTFRQWLFGNLEKFRKFKGGRLRLPRRRPVIQPAGEQVYDGRGNVDNCWWIPTGSPVPGSYSPFPGIDQHWIACARLQPGCEAPRERGRQCQGRSRGETAGQRRVCIQEFYSAELAQKWHHQVNRQAFGDTRGSRLGGHAARGRWVEPVTMGNHNFRVLTPSGPGCRNPREL